MHVGSGNTCQGFDQVPEAEVFEAASSQVHRAHTRSPLFDSSRIVNKSAPSSNSATCASLVGGSLGIAGGETLHVAP